MWVTERHSWMPGGKNMHMWSIYFDCCRQSALFLSVRRVSFFLFSHHVLFLNSIIVQCILIENIERYIKQNSEFKRLILYSICKSVQRNLRSFITNVVIILMSSVKWKRNINMKDKDKQLTLSSYQWVRFHTNGINLLSSNFHVS